ncbi:MAG: TonB-dependent receptor [Caulobacterales bacterium]|nr:TonB-dependent receptor [Caulobacterales bacterium]
MKRALFLATAASLAVTTPTLAQPDDENTVDEIVVTATRLDAPLDITPGAHIINEARIEASGALFVSDLLSEVPGVSLYSQGAPGGVTSVRLRGAAQDKTLVLLDGVPLNDPSQPAGGYDFAGLDLGDITRIEVLNGPQGSLWGSDAIGGVITLTSRELNGARVNLEAGSLDTLNANAAIGVAGARGSFGASMSAFQTDGVSRAAAGAERDGFESFSGGLNGRTTLGIVTLDGRVRYNRSEADLDGYPAPAYILADTAEVSDTESLSGYLRARAELFNLDQSLTYARSEIDRAISGGAFPSHYVGERTLWRWQAANGQITDRLGLVLGLEHEDAQGDLSTGAAAEQSTTSAFAAARYGLSDRLTASFSARLDDPDAYDAETTLRAGLAYDLGRGFVVSGSWGQGFKTPTISQSVCDFCFSLSPYPVLRPERAEGFDLGLAWRGASGGLRLTAYRLEVEDEISFFFDTGTFDSYYINLARTRSTGVEIQGDWRLNAALGLSAAYAWTDAENALTGARLLRVPEHAGSVTLDWDQGPWRAALTVRGEGDQLDVGGTREGFVTVRAAGGFALSDSVELTGRIENLTDETYQEVFGYAEPGRSAFVGIRLRY